MLSTFRSRKAKSEPPAPPKEPWELDAALELIRKIEAVCPAAGCHVALTGGVLYKLGERKDLDIIFYRERQRKIDGAKLQEILESLGIKLVRDFQWLIKAEYENKRIDILFPESRRDGAYVKEVYAEVDFIDTMVELQDI